MHAGMHSIKDRPVVVNGQIVIRPIMVVALTYDHRLLDGREATTFLGTRAAPAHSHCVSDVRRSQGPRLHPRPRQDASRIDSPPGTCSLTDEALLTNHLEIIRAFANSLSMLSLFLYRTLSMQRLLGSFAFGSLM